MIRNLRDLPGSLTLSAIVAGLVAVLVGYSGPLLIIVQAAEAANLDHTQASSWIWAVTIGCGVSALFLSLWYRQPVLVAWPTASAALLVSSLPFYDYPEAIGAYLVASVALVLLGISGLFGRIIELVPPPIIAGMLAGVLLRFGVNLFKSLGEAPILVTAMLLTYFVLRRLGYRAPSIGTLLVGLVVAGALGMLNFTSVALELTVPQWTMPVFTPRSLLGLSLPLFVLANASQNAPGIAVLRTYGYKMNVNGAILVTGIVSLITAPFGSHGLALAAITAAICVSPEAQPDPDRRYAAGVAYGFWYILFGLFGATAVSLFTGLPGPLVTAVAGLALTGALINALSGSMAVPEARDGALLAFLVTAADVPLLGIGAPFWGLVIGVAANYLLRKK